MRTACAIVIVRSESVVSGRLWYRGCRHTRARSPFTWISSVAPRLTMVTAVECCTLIVRHSFVIKRELAKSSTGITTTCRNWLSRCCLGGCRCLGGCHCLGCCRCHFASVTTFALRIIADRRPAKILSKVRAHGAASTCRSWRWRWRSPRW